MPKTGCKSVHTRFYNRVAEIINGHLSDSEFNVELGRHNACCQIYSEFLNSRLNLILQNKLKFCS